MSQSLSIKELRARLPEVLQNIQKGLTYMLIYQSKPVGQIGPLDSEQPKSKTKEKSLSFFSQSHAHIKFRTKKNAVDLLRADRA